jgi:Flp pilus assembly protein TadG
VTWRSDQRGSALVELSWLGILLVLPVLWIVMSVFEVQRGAFGVSSAARAAARAYALAPDDSAGLARAREAARVALDDQGVHGVAPEVLVTCTPYPGDCHQGTSVITVSVHSRVVLPLMPSALGGNRPSFALDATQTVPIGQFQEIDGG